MNRATLVAGLYAAACAAGVVLGGFTCRSIACRDALGIAFGRGHLLAITQAHGIYEGDLDREVDQLRYLNGQDDFDSVDIEEKRAVLSRLIATMTVMQLAKDETIPQERIRHGSDLIRHQFHDQIVWLKALLANHLSIRSLRAEVAAHLRARKWLERQLTDAEQASAQSRQYFDAHQELFFLPARFRASHLFLAAPAGTPAPIIDLKRRTMDSLSVRISHGEDFSELIGLTSEDEASKKRGGDLGFFSASRVPADFFLTIEKMKLGTTTPPVPTRLGFHIVRLTDRQAARRMTFEEAEGEIVLKLQNDGRKRAANLLTEKLLEKATFVRFAL